ncbi:hypothetical protein Tco_0115552 [Tanacetum coccineum]
MVCVTDILSHSHALNIIFTLPDDRNLHCCDSGWRNVLICHLAIESFLFRVFTQALIPLECIIPITMEEYIRLQEEKSLSQGETFNWQTATYGKMEYYEDEDDCFTNFESEFPAIVLDDTSREALSWEPTIQGMFVLYVQDVQSSSRDKVLNDTKKKR